MRLAFEQQLGYRLESTLFLCRDKVGGVVGKAERVAAVEEETDILLCVVADVGTEEGVFTLINAVVNVGGVAQVAEQGGPGARAHSVALQRLTRLLTHDAVVAAGGGQGAVEVEVTLAGI